MLCSVAFALALLLMAATAALFAWTLRAKTQRVRLCFFLPLGGGILALPILYNLTHEPPLGVKIAFTMYCPLIASKLLNLYMDAEHWRTQPLIRWVAFVPSPFVLNHRRYLSEKPRPRATNIRLLLRGMLQIVAGVLLFRWALGADISRHGFWIDHTVKVFAVYLFALDGAWVLLSGALGLMGMHVMSYSIHPIVARTPADFWRRYNREAGRFLFEDVYKPLRDRAPLRRAIFVTFLVNGLYHEYLAALLIGSVTGYQVAFFSLNGLAVAATHRHHPRGGWRFMAVAATILFLLTSSVFFFANVDRVAPGWFYSRGSILP